MASQLSSQVLEGASSCDKDLFILGSRQPEPAIERMVSLF
jgi:hypothetical protein